MGSAVQAKCECGYEEEFMIGGGMTTFHKLCLFPCLCRDCQQIVQANLLDTPAICPECKGVTVEPYDQEELCEQRGGEHVASWSPEGPLGRELGLTDGEYYCPSCDTFRLRFQDTGICWD